MKLESYLKLSSFSFSSSCQVLLRTLHPWGCSTAKGAAPSQGLASLRSRSVKPRCARLNLQHTFMCSIGWGQDGESSFYRRRLCSIAETKWSHPGGQHSRLQFQKKKKNLWLNSTLLPPTGQKLQPLTFFHNLREKKKVNHSGRLAPPCVHILVLTKQKYNFILSKETDSSQMTHVRGASSSGWCLLFHCRPGGRKIKV